jgi:GGDEF domain-containing protein
MVDVSSVFQEHLLEKIEDIFKKIKTGRLLRALVSSGFYRFRSLQNINDTLGHSAGD